MERENKEKVLTSETVVEILKKHGEDISMEDARILAKLIQYFASVAVNQLTKAD